MIEREEKAAVAFAAERASSGWAGCSRQIMDRVLASLLAVVVGTVVGCTSDGAAPSDTCEDDSGCGGGTVCAFSFCIDPDALGTVDIEVEPPGASNLPVQSIVGLDTSDNRRLEVSLARAVNVAGVVVDSDSAPLPAVVFALPVEGIVGRPRQRSTTSSVDGFSLPLVSGQRYRYAAVPESTTVPPAFPDTIFVAGQDGPVEVRAQAVQQVRGRIVGGGAEGTGLIALDNVDVLIVDSNDRQLSTIATTAVDGTFMLAVGVNSGDTQLVVRPNNQYPSVRIPIDLGTNDPAELGDRSLGTALFPVQITGVVRTSTGAPAEGATVVVRGNVGNGIVAPPRVVTGRDGTFSLNVVRGSYVIAAVGASDSRNGLAIADVDVSAGTIEGLVLDLPARVTAVLDVRTAEGEPVASSSVVLTRIGDVDTGISEPILDDAQPGFIGNTDERGRVSLDVDPGSYRVVIDPPRGQGTPSFSARLKIAGNLEQVITLRPSRVLAGQLKSGEASVGGAFVRVYSQIVDERGKAILLGEAFAESDGTFAVSVPSFEAP